MKKMLLLMILVMGILMVQIPAMATDAEVEPTQEMTEPAPTEELPPVPTDTEPVPAPTEPEVSLPVETESIPTPPVTTEATEPAPSTVPSPTEAETTVPAPTQEPAKPTVPAATEPPAPTECKHVYTPWQVDKQVTCTQNGHKKRTCTLCGVVDGQDVPAPGHVYGTWTETVKATCTKEGKKTATCTVCGYKATQTVPKAPHQFGEWKVVKEATCTEAGQETAVCKICGHKETRSLKKGGHQVETWKEITPATCTQEGKETGVCAACGKKVTRTIEKLPHDFQWVAAEKSTETKPGSGHQHCAVCGMDTPEETVPAHQVLNAPLKWKKGEDSSFNARIQGNGGRIKAVQLDGRSLDKTLFACKEGSMALTVDSKVLDKLSAGEHTMKVVYTDGECNTKLTVEEEAPTEPTIPHRDPVDFQESVPEPSGNMLMAARVGLIILGVAVLAGIVVFLVYLKRR